MTADEILAFCRALPPTVTRIEFDDQPAHGDHQVPGKHLGHVVIEQKPLWLQPTPEVGDVTRAAKAKEAAAQRSDVDSLTDLAPPVDVQ